MEDFSLVNLQKAAEFVWQSEFCRKTPLLKNVQHCFPQLPVSLQLHFKLESMQIGGCFKNRGAAYQVCMNQDKLAKAKGLVTYSGGNYGKAFASVTANLPVPRVVVMPSSAPINRKSIIESYGAVVVSVENAEIQPTLDSYTDQGYIYLHPFDDSYLISAYSSVAFEILEEVANPDYIIVGCGGGSLLSGISLGINSMGNGSTKMIGVEPETANTMYLSMKAKEPCSLVTAKSIANGLAPPYCGKITYEICSRLVEEILLVSDEEILAATKACKKLGLVVEPSGAAALASLLSGKIPANQLENKTVVIVVSGGNISADDYNKL